MLHFVFGNLGEDTQYIFYRIILLHLWHALKYQQRIAHRHLEYISDSFLE